MAMMLKKHGNWFDCLVELPKKVTIMTKLGAFNSAGNKRFVESKRSIDMP